MPRFDVHESSETRLTEFRQALFATFRSNPAGVASMLFITLVAMLLATAFVSIAVAIPDVLRTAFVSNPVLVFAVPGATRAEVESLDARLKALPMVADVSLRSKDAALSALIEAGLPAAVDGRNPLPDVWTVHLRLRGETQGNPNFVTVVVGARDAIASLPTVEKVKFDDAWVTLLDRSARGWSTSGMPSLVLCLLVSTASVMIVYGLFSRSLDWPNRIVPGRRKLVLAFVDLIIVLVASSITFLLFAWFVSSSALAGMALLKPIADQAGLTSQITVASIGLITLIAAWLGSLTHAKTHDSFSR